MSAKRQGKCTKEIIEKVCILICQGCSWVKIEQVIGISRRMMRNWRDQAGEFYEKDFDEAVKAAQEKFDCGNVKANQFLEANKHTLTKRIYELRPVDIRSLGKSVKLPKGARRLKGKNRQPPPMPPSHFIKQEISEYAETFLDLKLPVNKTFTKGKMRIACQKRLYELTAEIMVKTREEPQEVAANQQAVKNVLTNAGPKKERWTFKEELTHEVEPKSIADIMAIMGIGSDSKNKRN